MPEHHVQAFTYELRDPLLPQLSSSLSACGGWLLDRRALSLTTVEVLLEIQLRGVLDLYATLAAAGIELTREGRQTLTGLCIRARNGRTRRIGEVVAIRLELRFMEDVPLSAFLNTRTTVT